MGSDDETHLRDRRRRLLPRQGAHRLQPRTPAPGARAAGDDAEARPVPQRRPGHDEPVPARRGLRHRRRRRDRPGHRPLRAVPRRQPRAAAPTSRPARSTTGSSPRSGAGSTSATPSRSSRTSPTRSRSGCGPRRRLPGRDDEDAPDVIITEIGGTVGDIESLPFLEAARQVRHDLGRDNVFFLHVSLVPYLAPSGELKTKPTQHSVAALRQVGIQPDALVLRADRDIPESIKRKIASCATSTPRPSPPPSTRRASTTSPRCCTARAWTPTSCAGSAWPSATSTGPTGTPSCERVHQPEHEVEVALVGKYIDLPDAYLSVTEALRAGGFHHDAKVNIRWVPSDDCQTAAGAQRALGGVDAVLVPGRLRRPRHRGQGRGAALGPRNGRCRPWASAWACSAWSSSTPAPSPASRARAPRSSTRTARPRSSRRWRSRRPSSRVRATSAGRCASGSQRALLTEGSVVAGAYGADHGGRAAPAPLRGQRRLPRPGSRTPGWSSAGPTPTLGLVEFVELPREVHPYYVATQAHPEFKSRPTRAHPLFAGLVGAALEQQRAARLVEVERPRSTETADLDA